MTIRYSRPEFLKLNFGDKETGGDNRQGWGGELTLKISLRGGEAGRRTERHVLSLTTSETASHSAELATANCAEQMTAR